MSEDTFFWYAAGVYMSGVFIFIEQTLGMLAVALSLIAVGLVLMVVEAYVV